MHCILGSTPPASPGTPFKRAREEGATIPSSPLPSIAVCDLIRHSNNADSKNYTAFYKEAYVLNGPDIYIF